MRRLAFVLLALFLLAQLCYRQGMAHGQDMSEIIVAEALGSEGGDDVLAISGEDELRATITALREEVAIIRKVNQELLVRCRNLEKGLLTTTSESLDEEQKQLTLDILGSLLTQEHDQNEPAADEDREIDVPAHKRKRRPRKLPTNLPVSQQTVVPQAVLDKGFEHFDIIGEERSETLERRPSKLFRVVTIRPKFVAKDRDRDRRKATQRARDLAGESYTEVLIADPPPHPIPKSLAGPGLLADTVVSRFQDHLPLNRLEGMLKREGVDFHRSTMCQWHSALSDVVKPVVDAMWEDARSQPILYTDATGVRVRAKKKCRRAHFWAVIAPERHILFAFTKNHKKTAVDRVIGNFAGYLVADAHTVYDHLYLDNSITEVGCWAHARRYLHKTLNSQPDIAMVGLAMVNQLFRLERRWKSLKPEPRRRQRQRHSRPIIDRYFRWCDAETATAIQETPLDRALTYSRNQRDALVRFLEDGRLPLHNNASEGALRRQAVGRKNWLFLGNNEAGTTNARMVTLLASCQLHDIEPRRYLLELFCLLPIWPSECAIDLAPCHWKETRLRSDVELQLMNNTHWRAATGELCPPLTNE